MLDGKTNQPQGNNYICFSSIITVDQDLQRLPNVNSLLQFCINEYAAKKLDK